MLSSYGKFLRPLLFTLSPEGAHGLAFSALGLAEKTPFSRQLLAREFSLTDPWLQVEAMGLTFPNPVGLAAGFDKNAEAVDLWECLGFGFCEMGTVTAKPQAGNPKPRLFRLPEDQALINRMGFNNIGAEAMARQLKKKFARQRPGIPVGINIGKSKTTELSEATTDYLFSLENLYGFADYFVVNVSSPNTPGLRELQDESALRHLLEALIKKGRDLSRQEGCREKPILTKLAPDLRDEDFHQILKLFLELGLAGVVLTNTTISRDGLHSAAKHETGGLSGLPVRARSTEMIRQAKQIAGDQLTIIGCGGIFSFSDAWEKMQAGAALVQIYTGYVYEGPSLPKRINQGILSKK